ncbi:MAG: J domain-containing protein [Alphaproteobacteria bacterium]
MARDPYLELGVSRGASASEIRKAFHKLAKQHHPDTNPGNKAAEERFKQVSAAFDILGDVDKRKKFDAGEIDADGRETFRGFGGNPGGAGYGGGQRGAAFDGVDLSDLFGDILGRGRGGAGFAPRGADVRAKVEIDLEDAIHGGKKRISFSDGRTIDMTIPMGAEDGQSLRLKGQGAPGRAGPGDAMIELIIKPHAIFRREGESLVMDLPVSIPDAILGGKVQAPTPDGAVTLTVPKGANSGQSLRLKGKGLSDAAGRRGDLIARLLLVLPEILDDDLIAFAEKWRTKRPYTPRKR